MGNSETFSIFIHHGGSFEEVLNVDCCVGGNVVIRPDLDPDRFGYFDIRDLVDGLGIVSWNKVRYHIPNSKTYTEIKSDTQVMEMLSFLSARLRSLHIYVDGAIYGQNLKKGEEGANLGHNEESSGAANARENKGDLGGQLGDNVWGSIGEYGLDATIDDYSWENDSELDGDVHADEDFTSEDDLDYLPPDEESSDDSLDDTDLASSDEEYIQGRRNNRAKADQPKNLFDIIHNTEAEGSISDYESCDDDDFNSSETDDDDDVCRPRRKKNVYDPRCNHKLLEFKLGLRFDNGFQCKSAITDWAIENGRFVRFRRVSKTQCEAKCTPQCPWRVYASVIKSEKTFMIKSIGGEHTCPRSMDNKLITSRWIANKYLKVFRVRPNLSAQDLRMDILEKYANNIPKDRLYKAMAIAQELVRGLIEEHYSLLRSYVAEHRRVDREGRFELLLGEEHVFKGLYLGYSSLIKGFKMGCRHVIGLDGCFLKTHLGGILMCAVGKDGNNQMFPIAWAVVEIENEECWTWFLKNLFEDLGITNGEEWIIISDQQKGLENAVRNLAPRAEHRNCARHVYMNWRKNHSGTELRKLFWRAVKCTYVEEYKLVLEELKKESLAAFQDFISRDVHRFCKAFISENTCNDMITNNISESFNNYILNARSKHIIHMCEEIRISLMTRQVDKLRAISKVCGTLCPQIQKKFEKLRSESRWCIPKPALGGKFEVQINADTFVVSVGSNSCTCRKWQLTGIPCIHAISAIQFMQLDPYTFVNECYTVGKYLESYKFGLEPLNGERMWPEVEGFKVKPPLTRKMPGRPKKKRRRAVEEVDPKNPNKLKKGGFEMTCSNCYQKGHNARGCKNEAVPKPTKEKGKRGRPRKVVSQSKGKDVPSTLRMHVGGRNMARRGAGVYINEGSGNIYLRIPDHRRVTHVSGPRGGRAGASTSGIQTSGLVEGPVTQESRADRN